MKADYVLTCGIARTGLSATIQRTGDGSDVQLRGDEVLQLFDDLAESPSKIDTVRHWFIKTLFACVADAGLATSAPIAERFVRLGAETAKAAMP